MDSTSEKCPQCELLSAKVTALEAELGRVRQQLAAANKNSATSSKPPSSDIVKPKPPERPDGQKRSIGGQPGHDKHERSPFPSEQVTGLETHTLEACPGCGGPLRLNPTIPRVVQQVDIEK
jgi:transposase